MEMSLFLMLLCFLVSASIGLDHTATNVHYPIIANISKAVRTAGVLSHIHCRTCVLCFSTPFCTKSRDAHRRISRTKMANTSRYLLLSMSSHLILSLIYVASIYNL